MKDMELTQKDTGTWNRIYEVNMCKSCLDMLFGKVREVKFSLFTPRIHVEEAEVQLHSFLTSTLDGGEVLTVRPGLCPRKTVSIHTEYEVGWAPEAFWNCQRGENVCPIGIPTPDRPASSLNNYTDCATTVNSFQKYFLCSYIVFSFVGNQR